MSNDHYQAKPLKICLIAGENSGDMLGGKLMTALNKISNTPIQFSGIGGERMKKQGLDSFFPISDLSIMGISEILPYIPRLLSRIKETTIKITSGKPDAVVTIDSPGFSLRVASKLKRSNPDIRLIHYVAPSVWAWKPWRAKRMSRYLDRVLTLFQFELQYFDAVGLDSVFVGHPILQSGAMRGDGIEFRTNNGIPPDIKLICILPGSRLVEVSKHLPIIEHTLELLSKKNPIFEVVLPLADDVATSVKSVVQKWPYSITFTEGDDDSKYNAFAASNVALACSGTVALELALADIPYVTIYKMSLFSGIVARSFVKLKYVNLINILLDKEVVPELILENCKPNLILPHLVKALNDTEFRSKQRKYFKAALDLITVGGNLPSERAAQAVLEVIAEKSVFKHNSNQR